MVKRIDTEKPVLEIKLDGLGDIPKAVALADLLQEWVTWVKTYGSFISTDEDTVSLYQRSREAVKKWGRHG